MAKQMITRRQKDISRLLREKKQVHQVKLKAFQGNQKNEKLPDKDK